MRIPSDASIQVKDTFRQIADVIRPLRGSVWNLGGRRITGAPDAREPTDLVPLRQARNEFNFDSFYERLRVRGLDGFPGTLRDPQLSIVDTPNSTTPPPVTGAGRFFYEPDTGRWRYADGTQLVTVSATGDAIPEAGVGGLLRSDGVATLTGARNVDNVNWSWRSGSGVAATAPTRNVYRSRDTLAAPADIVAADRLGVQSAYGWRNGAYRQAGELLWDAEALGASAVQGRLTLRLADTSGTLSDRVILGHTHAVFVDQIVANTDYGVTGVLPTGTPLYVNQPAASLADLMVAQLGGVTKFVVNKDGQIILPDGSASKPAYSFSTGSGVHGMYLTGTSTVGFASAGVLRWAFDSSGQWRSFQNGSLSTVAIGRSGNINTGLYWPATNEVALVGGGNRVIHVGNNTVGFFNVTPVAQTGAFTQTYSSFSHSHPNLTSNNLSLTSTNSSPWGFSSQAEADSIQTEVNALRADVINVKQLCNAIIDDLQSYGLFQ